MDELWWYIFLAFFAVIGSVLGIILAKMAENLFEKRHLENEKDSTDG